MPSRALRWISGFSLTFMLVTAGWMFTRRRGIYSYDREINWGVVCWLAATMGSLALLGIQASFQAHLDRRWLYSFVGATMLIFVWPAIRLLNPWLVMLAIPVAGTFVASFWFLAWGTKRYLLGLALATCLLLCIPFFNASSAWWRIGFVYGTERFPEVANPLTNGLPTLLKGFLGWQDIHDTAFQIPRAWLLGWPRESLTVTVRAFLLAIFMLLFAAAGGAIARHWRRRDPRLLVALTLPWVLFYTILPEISPRYAVFVAGIGAICIGQSIGMAVVMLFFSGIALEQTALCMTAHTAFARYSSDNPLFNNQVLDILSRCNPGIAWAEVLAACAFLYATFTCSGSASSYNRAPEINPVNQPLSTERDYKDLRFLVKLNADEHKPELAEQ
jgi:hypothetical protein